VPACALALCTLAGCATSTDLVVGGPDGGAGLFNGSCNESVSTSGFTFRYCADYVGLTADQVSAIQSVCAAGADAGTGVSVAGTYSTGICDHTGSVGGCAIASGGFSSTLWWWTAMGGMDVSQYMSQCTAEHGTWLAP